VLRAGSVWNGRAGVTETLYDGVGSIADESLPENEVGEAADALTITAPLVPTWLTPNTTVRRPLTLFSARLTVPGAAEQLATPEQATLTSNVTTAPFVLVLRFSTRKDVLSEVDRAAVVFDGSSGTTTTL